MTRLQKLNQRKLSLPSLGTSAVAEMYKGMAGRVKRPEHSAFTDDELYRLVSGMPPHRWHKIPITYDEKISQLIWKPFTGGQPLAENHGFLEWFVGERINGSECLYRALINSMTWWWPGNVDELIAKFSGNTDSRVIWPSISWRKQAILKASTGLDISELVAEQWGGQPSLSRGLVGQLWKELVTTAGQRLSAGNNVMGYLRAIEKVSFDGDGQFRWPNHEVTFLDQLLPPLLAKISSGVSLYLKGCCLRAFGRPGSGVWLRASADAQKVGIQWLATLRVERFFDYVEKYQRLLGMADNLRHLKDRRAFWEKAFEAGIDAVELAFGENLYKQLIVADREMIKPANLTTRGTGFSPDHAALIIKIKNMTMVEWSHSRASCVWLKSNSKAPVCNKFMYVADNLVKDPDEKVQHRGDWQSKYANLIHQETGVWINRGR